MEGGGNFGIGTDILVKASVNLFDLIKADIVVETAVKLIAVTCHPELNSGDKGFPETPTIWGIAQVNLTFSFLSNFDETCFRDRIMIEICADS